MEYCQSDQCLEQRPCRLHDAPALVTASSDFSPMNEKLLSKRSLSSASSQQEQLLLQQQQQREQEKTESTLYLSIPDNTHTPEHLSLEYTFQYMMYRKVQRKFFGEMLEDESAWTVFWIVLVIPWFSVYLYNFFLGEVEITIDNIIKFLGAFFLVLIILSSVKGIWRWLTYWVIGGYVLWVYYPSFVPSNVVGISIILCLEFLTIFTFFFRKYIYPILVRRIFSPQCWWRYRKSHKKLNSFSYHAAVDYMCRRYPCSRCKVSYTGEAHPVTRVPHGYGGWLDDEYYGECLQGWWRDGIPIGPFVSRTTGTSSVSLCTRIAFVSNSTDEWHTRALIPLLTEQLGYGVASVECNVSGIFMHNMPHVIEPFVLDRFSCVCPIGTECQCVSVCSELLDIVDEEDKKSFSSSSFSSSSLSTTTTTVSSTSTANTTCASSIIPSTLLPTPSAPSMTISSPPATATINIPSTSAPAAAVRFHTHVRAPSTPEIKALVAQSFDNKRTLDVPSFQVLFPTDEQELIIKLRRAEPDSSAFMLSIPNRISLPQPKTVLILIPGYNCPLSDALKRLAQLSTLAQFPSYIQPFVFHWPSGNIPSYFMAKKVAESEKMREDFTVFVRGLLRAGFVQMHILAHSMGARVLFNSFPGFQRYLKPAPGSRTSEEKYGESLQLMSLTLLHPDYPLAPFVSNFAQYRHVCDLITLYADPNDGALSWAQRFTKEDSLGLHLRQLCQPDASGPRWLNMDVMDTSSVVNNVHNIRHSFFDLNTTIIEDLRELITTFRRASARTARVIPKTGNVFTFLTVPAWVKN